MKKLTLILWLACSLAIGQGKLTASITQDARLAFIGDDYGNDPYTANILASIAAEKSISKGWSYSVGVTYEYSDMHISYNRCGLEYGLFKRIRSVDLGVLFSPAFSWRYSDMLVINFNPGMSGVVKYRISDKVKCIAIMQVVQRNDMGSLYGKTKCRASGFIGIEIEIFNGN